ncbi:MAG: Uma2 family endonuclease [Selenomonadaceae bacterium]|nr:Uma2 family endonuclease [Selenomonadaceae bacterium]
MKDDVYEIIRGEKILFPSANLIHGSIAGRVGASIVRYLDADDSGYVFGNVGVKFDDENIFIPDVVVVLKPNEKIIDWKKIIDGSPDMVVEVLSKSTRRNDLTVKKDTYEANGVREYWIVDPWAKSVTVYLLRDGKYFLDDDYVLFDEDELESLIDEQKAEVKHEVPVKILGELKIPLKYIVKWGYNQ